MDEKTKMRLAQDLVATCSRQAYQDQHGSEHDIPSRQQTVSAYMVPVNQLKYIHMYFAKYVGLWRLLAKTFAPGGPYHLWSLGAGPLLDVIGWLWDHGDGGDGVVVTAVDALPWETALKLPELCQLYQAVGRRESIKYRSNTYFPGPTKPGQVCACAATTALLPDEIPDGAVVLIPFVMNHLLGKNQGLGTPGTARLGAWLGQARARAQLVVVADIPLIDGGKSDTSYLWRKFSAMLSTANDPCNLVFANSIQEFMDVYPDPVLRSRRCSRHMSQAVVAIGDQDGWRYISNRDIARSCDSRR